MGDSSFLRFHPPWGDGQKNGGAVRDSTAGSIRYLSAQIIKPGVAAKLTFSSLSQVSFQTSVSV